MKLAERDILVVERLELLATLLATQLEMKRARNALKEARFALVRATFELASEQDYDRCRRARDVVDVAIASIGPGDIHQKDEPVQCLKWVLEKIKGYQCLYENGQSEAAEQRTDGINPHKSYYEGQAATYSACRRDMAVFAREFAEKCSRSGLAIDAQEGE